MMNTLYKTIENYMLSQMTDSAHDPHHIYRVLNTAKDIAAHEMANGTPCDMAVLIAACLLHDIGRNQQFANPSLCHAEVGGKMAFEFIMSQLQCDPAANAVRHTPLWQGWNEAKAVHVQDCISSHRYRGDNRPQSIEAQILFEADKIDACGIIGIARTLLYAGKVDHPIYILDESGHVKTTGNSDSFVQEYHHKLKNIDKALNTARAKEIAAIRQRASQDFYHALISEISG